MQEPSIFTRIINGEIPAHKIYEDDRVIAFLDIHPMSPGHTLVIPKRQIEFVWDLSDDDYHAVWSVAKKVAIRLREVFPEKKRIAVHVEGLDVPHAHVKIFAFDNVAEFRHLPDASAEPDHTALAQIAEKLRFS